MTHIVEDGTGIALANVYAGEGFVRNYLSLRNRAATWDAATDVQRDAALIAATQYIDVRWGARFMGRKEFLTLTRQALGFLRIVATAGLNNKTLTIGTTVYTFKNALASAFDVLIGADASETSQNLTDAINLTGTPGTQYHAATTIHPDVTAEAGNGGHLHVMAKVAGEAGNLIVMTTDAADTIIYVDSDTLLGGSDEVEQPLEFPRLDLVGRTGRLVTGVPDKIKFAMAEYADRALSAVLMPDPTIDATGRAVLEIEKRVGPISTRTRYEDGAALSQIMRPYPAADRLLEEYVHPPGRVYRG